MKTLLVLPNAIGDVICGVGIARHFARDGELTWIVNESAAGLVDHLGFHGVTPPSDSVRRRAGLGAPTETLWRQTQDFLDSLHATGPYDLVLNPHLSRPASLMAGSVDAAQFRGPALGSTVISDAWSDFFMASIVHGCAPEVSAVARFSLIACLQEPAWPHFDRRPHADQGSILFIPAAGWPSKSLSPEVAASVADQLADLGPVRFLGSSGDAEFIMRIRGLMKSTPEDFSPGSMQDAFDSILAAQLVVSVDTWALHAASAAGVPVFGILGPTRVFPRAHSAGEKAAAISPRQSPSWKSHDDRTLDQLSADEIIRAILDFHREESSNPEKCISWDCRSDFPLPSKSFEGGPQPLFAWARARAFCDLVEMHLPDQPTLRLRPREDMRIMYSDLDDARMEVMRTYLAKAQLFPLFETTFPGLDPDKLQRNWIRGTAEYVRCL
ncbi:MAG: glycosyltransferase family 9 protein [Candidatus Hydrogenedentota bacterium]